MNGTLILRDVAKQAPRSPRARVAAFVIAACTADQCRACLAGTPGEYQP